MEGDKTGIEARSVIPAYGVVRCCYLHHPWPTIEEAPPPTLLVEVRWLPPVVFNVATPQQKEHKGEFDIEGKGEGKEEKRSGRPEEKNAVNRGRSGKSTGRRSGRSARGTGRGTLKRQEFDQRLPLVHRDALGHDWNRTPITSLALAYPTPIMLLPHPTRGPQIYCALDLCNQCPSPFYPSA
jgi:hypothetical protein